MRKIIIIFTVLIFLSGCASLGNREITYIKYGPGPIKTAKILERWTLNMPGKANVEIEGGKVKYTGSTPGILENLKDLLMLKAVQTDISVSNKEGK